MSSSSFFSSLSSSFIPLTLIAFAALLHKKHKKSSTFYAPQLPPCSSPLNSLLSSLCLDDMEFLDLLRSFIRETEKLQNTPPDIIPQEEIIADLVIAFLKPYSQPNGPLIVKKITYVKGRSNVIITYPAAIETEKTVAFVGSQ